MLKDIPINCHRSLFKKIEAGYSKTDIYFEGAALRGDNAPPMIEVRMDGPWFEPLLGGEVQVQFEANILIITQIDQGIYQMDEIGGLLFQLLYDSLDITDKDGNFLGCAKPYTDHRKRLEFNKFGRIDKQSELLHSTVEIRYEVTLEI